MGKLPDKVLQTLIVLLVTVIVVQAVTSCRGRCGGSYRRDSPCQCNRACTRFDDCCHDYQTLCDGGGRPGGAPVAKQPISSRDISRLAHSLWTADTNRVPGMMYSIRKQTRISHLFRRRDRAPKSFNTDVIQSTYNLLYTKGHFSSEADFKDFMKTTWFGLYSRSGGTLDSSAFEHTFVGEMKNGAVTGFHNWIQFCLQERAGNLNYYGYRSEKQPNQLLLQFNWSGQVKTLSSIMYGVSPEFELALFSVCFIARPNDRCTFTINGHDVAIRTWKIEGDKLGAAYFHV
eukprot:XP_798998.3 PREDICTED: poly(U)-specific endoribonuclease [Strongylocentrotus purpuratus]